MVRSVPAHLASLRPTSPPPLICFCLLCFLCSAGLPFERFLLADRLRSKRDKHKHTIGVASRDQPSFKSDGQTSQLRRGHSSSHSVTHFPPTGAPSPARPSRRLIRPFFLNLPHLLASSPHCQTIAHRPSPFVAGNISIAIASTVVLSLPAPQVEFSSPTDSFPPVSVVGASASLAAG